MSTLCSIFSGWTLSCSNKCLTNKNIGYTFRLRICFLNEEDYPPTNAIFYFEGVSDFPCLRVNSQCENLLIAKYKPTKIDDIP